MKRGYLLPQGCKDLIDVAKLKFVQSTLLKPLDPMPTFNIQTKPSPSSPPLTRQVFIFPQTTVKKLAALLGQKPFTILCDLVQFGTFASVDDLLDFKMISVIARRYGFTAIKAGFCICWSKFIGETRQTTRGTLAIPFQCRGDFGPQPPVAAHISSRIHSFGVHPHGVGKLNIFSLPSATYTASH